MLRQRSWLLSVFLLSLCGWLGGAIASAQTIVFVNASGASTATVLEKSRAQVWIIDPSLNFYSSVPDLVGVTFTSAATGDQDQVVFYETGPSTGVFVGGIDLVDGPAGFDGLLSTETGPPPTSTLDTIQARYQRSGGSYQSVTATVVPSAATLIDELGRKASSVAVFHKIHVRVEDHNADSPLEIGTVTVQMTTISGDLETLVLKETGAATQIYEGSIESNTGPTFAVPGDGAVQLIPQAGDGVTATHLDLNSSTQSSDSATAATAYLTFIDENGRPVTSLLENSKAYLRLYDWFTNGSPTYRDYASVQVYAGVSGDQEWVGLYETGPNTHVFEGAVQLGSGPAYTDGIVTTSRIAGPPVEFDSLTASYSSYEGPYLNVIAGLTGASEISFLDEFGRLDEFVPIGGDLRIQVRDPSIRRSDRALVTVTSTGSGDSETVTLLRLHGGSDVFEGKIRVSGEWANANNRILESSAGDVIVAEHADANGLTSSTASTRASSLEIQMLDADGRPADPLLEYGPVRVRLFDRAGTSYQSDLNLFSKLAGDYERVPLSTPADGVSEGTVLLMPGSYSYGDGKLGVAPTRLTPPTRSDTVKAEILCYSLSVCPPVRAGVTGGVLTFLNALGHPVEAFAPGEPIHLRLEKHSENLPTVIDQAEVTVRAVPNGSTLTVTLTETGVNTGIFQGSLLTANADGPPTTGTLRMRVGETVGATWEFPPDVFVATDTARVQAATFELLDENGDPLETILAGRPITIRVFNPAENTSPSYPNALPAEFLTLQGNLGQLDRELVGAYETGPDTSLFIGTAQTRFDYPSYMDGTVQILSGATWGDLNFNPVRLDVTVGDAHARLETRASVTRLINAQGNDVERIGLGSPVRLQVEFHGAGDPGSPDQVQAWVWSEPTDDFETVTLTETGADTGIFEGSIPTASGSNPQEDGTLQGGAGTLWAAHFSPNNGHLYSIDSGVSAPNQPPVAVDDEITFDEDSVPSITLNVLANDSDPEGQPLQVTAISAPTGYGTFTLNPDGSITYAPTPNQYYSIQIEYTLSDGTSSVTGRAYFYINPIPDPPTAVPDTVTVLEGGQVQISVLDNDQVGDVLGLAVGAVTNSAHGNAVNLGNTWVVWTATDPDYSGTDTFTYVLEGGDGQTAIGTVTVIIEPVDDGFIAFDDAASTPEDSAVTVNVLANDLDVDSPKSVTAVTQPAHGTAVINPDFSITYTPAANYAGPDSFTYTGLGSPNDDQGLVTITVNPVNDAPDAVNDAATTAEDTAATITVLSNDTDPDGNSLTVTAVTQGAHGSVTFTANSITFTPAANYNGSDSFTYTISDGNGGSDTATVNVTITAANDAPDAVNDATTTAEDTAKTITVLVNDTDLDNDSLSVSAVTQGAHGTVTFTANSVTFTPAANYNGSDSFTYTVSDGNGGSDTATVNVTITAANDAPDAVNDAATTAEDAAATITVLTNDTDPENDSLSVTAVTQGAHGSVTFTANSVTFTPAANYNGSDSFTYTISDGNGGTDTATVNVTITAVNDAPAAVADAASTAEDTAVPVSVLANDTDPENNALSITGVTQGTKGSVTFTTGSVTYTPAANANGADSFTYTISDGNGGSATGTVSITINPVNDAPDAVNDSATTAEDTATTITVLTNDTDPENDSLSVTAVTQGAHGTVTFTATSVTFTPAADYNGTDTFTYTVSDGNGGTDTATVNVTITAVNDAPAAVADAASTAEDTAVPVSVLANDTDPENNALTITGVTQGTKGSVTFTAGSVTYTPAANANGADSFTYTISDGNGGTATGTVSITITPANDAPDAINDAASTLEDTAVVIPVLANDLDVDGESLLVTAVTQGTRGAVTINGNGTVTYTPNLNTNGADSFTYTVRDAAGATDTATVSLSVAAVNDPPVAVADAATTRENTAVTVTVLPNDSDVEGNTLAVTTVSAPAFGTAVGNPGNSISYTPSANFNGTDTFTYTVSDGQGGTATATVTITVKDALERVAVLGTNSVYLMTGSDVLSGDVIVNQSGTGPFLNGSVELSIAGTVTTPAGYDVTGNRINLASGAVVNGDAFYNTFTGTGSISGGQTSSLTLPVFSPLPAFQTATPGTTNVSVGTNGNRTLAAGSYLDLVVGRKGTVTFTGGTYHFRSITIDREAKLIFNAASQIRVQQKLSTATLTTIGPATGASFDASSLIFYVGGANGTTGGLAETPKAVEIGTDNVLKANVYAPNGTLWLRDRTQATGAFLAKDVQVGADAQVTLDSFYVGQ